MHGWNIIYNTHAKMLAENETTLQVPYDPDKNTYLISTESWDVLTMPAANVNPS
jgi:hypothetical protein